MPRPYRPARLSADTACRSAFIDIPATMPGPHQSPDRAFIRRPPRLQPYNPLGCWTGGLHRSRGQLRHQVRIADQDHQGNARALDRAATAAPAAAPTPDAAPAALTVVDTSDNSADLAWVPLAGIATYRISRAAPTASSRRWAIRQVPVSRFGAEPAIRLSLARLGVVNGIEGPPSVEISATTRPFLRPARIQAAARSTSDRRSARRCCKAGLGGAVFGRKIFGLARSARDGPRVFLTRTGIHVARKRDRSIA